MSEYSDILRHEIVLRLKKEDGDNSFVDALQSYIKKALQAAHEADKITFPEAAFSHNMTVAHAIDELRNPKKQRWFFDELIRWMANVHSLDVSSLVSRALRDNPDLDIEATADDILTLGQNMIEDGDFGVGFAPQTEIARSQWNGLNHDFHIQSWSFEFKESRVGPMRMGAILRPLLPAQLPEAIEVELHFPTGRVLISSDAIIKGLGDKHIKMRQATEPKGLQAEIAVTEEILYEEAMLAYGVCSTQLSVRRGADGLSLIHPGRDDADLDAGDSFLLDYRHMIVADQAAYFEALREDWRDKPEVLQERYEQARTECTLSVQEIEVKPGRYLVTIPANHQRCFSGQNSRIGSANFTAFSMKWIADR